MGVEPRCHLRYGLIELFVHLNHGPVQVCTRCHRTFLLERVYEQTVGNLRKLPDTFISGRRLAQTTASSLDHSP